MKWALAILLVATAAHANVWQHASEHGPDDVDDIYNDAMREGDAQTELAHTRSASIRQLKQHVDSAVAAYKQAAMLHPKDGEPWFRAGMVLYQFYFECDEGARLPWIPPRSPLCVPFDRDKAKETIAAWDELEKRAPLDPRLSFTDNNLEENALILFQRAILHTRLIDGAPADEVKRQLTAAAADYEKLVQRIDSSEADSLIYEETVGNLAETYMMLGQLDRSVETYREALRHGGRSSTAYGLAVALDRDDRGSEALEVVRDLGEEQVARFHEEVQLGSAFFVPKGEVFYYYALLEEAYGRLAQAANYWRMFIQSGAHPEFQPRAKQHLDAIAAKHVRQEAPHLEWLDP